MFTLKIHNRKIETTNENLSNIGEIRFSNI